MFIAQILQSYLFREAASSLTFDSQVRYNSTLIEDLLTIELSLDNSTKMYTWDWPTI